LLDVALGPGVRDLRDAPGDQKGHTRLKARPDGHRVGRLLLVTFGEVAEEGDALLRLTGPVDTLDVDARIVVLGGDLARPDVGELRLDVVRGARLLGGVELDPVEV